MLSLLASCSESPVRKGLTRGVTAAFRQTALVLANADVETAPLPGRLKVANKLTANRQSLAPGDPSGS